MELFLIALVAAFFFFYRSSKKSKKVTQKTIRDTPKTKADVLNGIDNTAYRFIAVDVETANKNPASICQIGLAFVDHENHITVQSFYVNPKSRFNPSFISIHGITLDMVRDSKTFSEHYSDLRETLESAPLVQHSSFDKTAIDAACERDDLPEILASWYDSVVITRRAWPELRSRGGHGLANLKKVHRLKFKHHDAGEDARAAAEIVLLAERQTGLTMEELATPKRSRKARQTTIALEGRADGPLFGESVCFTGQLSISREEASIYAARLGIAVKTTVSKKVSMLVVGDQDLSQLAGHSKSGKHRRAEELVANGHTMQIIGESDFMQLLDEHRH